MTRRAVALLALVFPALLHAAVTPGEILISEMNCAACHDAGPLTTRLASRESPRLGAEGVRVSPQWLREFLADPQRAQPNTLMPDALHALAPEQKAEAVEALTHFLVGLQPPAPAAGQRANAATIAEGERLYHTIGCVMCHGPTVPPPGRETDAAAKDELAQLQQSSVPLGDGIAKKFAPAELSRFLRDPLKARPAGRMPGFQLSEREADAIAMFLLRAQAAPGEAMRPLGDAPFTVDAAKAARGREIFAQMNCAACHAGTDVPMSPAKPLAQLAARQPRGCLSTKPGASVPKFEITNRQRQVILSLLQEKAPLQLPLDAEHQLRRALTTLNCYACHIRDRRGGADGLRRDYLTSTGATGDDARIPPSLTGIGAKLTREQLQRALEGVKLRPQMLTRMPAYGPTNTTPLPELFEQADKRANP